MPKMPKAPNPNPSQPPPKVAPLPWIKNPVPGKPGK